MMGDDWQVITGDCLEVMRGMDADSVDTIITDPPYGLSFMGKEWDHGVPGVHFWQEALRVAKPGAMMLAFGGTRTFHRLAVAIEDAGWELRDTIMWVYGSGFPKSHDISKAIDRAAGEEREVVGERIKRGDKKAYKQNVTKGNEKFVTQEYQTPITAPATDAARQWDGWGTALKPAWEPIIVAMKPLDGTFAANALRHGVAGLWVDGGRVEAVGQEKHAAPGSGTLGRNGIYGTANEPLNSKQVERANNGQNPRYDPSGRWPANVIHDGSDEVLAGFPVSVARPGKPENIGVSGSGEKRGLFGIGSIVQSGYYDTEKSAARFFYCAKSSRAERDAGLEGMTKARQGNRPGSPDPTGKFPDHDQREKGGNNHPTVKPLALMRHLARLTKTPTGGVVLDPFAGSGSTGCAAVMEGRRFIGIEIDEDYADIARARIAKAAEQARQEPLPL